MNAEGSDRRGFRFGERRRAGLLGAVPAALAAVGGVGLAAAWLAVVGLVPVPVAGLIAVVCAVLAFGKVHGRPAHEILPALGRWWWRRVRARHRWHRPVALVADGSEPVNVPPCLSGIDLYEIDVDWLTPGDTIPMGAVHDRRAGTVTTVVEVAGDGQFGLLDPADQNLRIDEWGTAIAGFARENSPVTRVTFHDWTAPMPIRDSVHRLEDRWADEPETPARAHYLELVRETSATVVNHDVHVEVTIDIKRLGRTRGERTLTSALRTAAEQTRLFAGRLNAANLRVESVLSASDIVTATRVRSDPTVVDRITTLHRSLAAATGRAAPTFGPMHVVDNLASVAVDGAVHRTWWFARWPRREVPAAWLDSLMFDTGCTRTFTVVFEPVAPSRSDHDVDRERTQREANIESRRRKGFLIRRADTKAVQEVEAREDELASGYIECLYAGLLTVTSANLDDLERSAADIEQCAANIGIELQPLWGRQADGWIASLPLGRNVARRLGVR